MVNKNNSGVKDENKLSLLSKFRHQTHTPEQIPQTVEIYYKRINTKISNLEPVIKDPLDERTV